jgi:hypothetical protein
MKFKLLRIVDYKIKREKWLKAIKRGCDASGGETRVEDVDRTILKGKALAVQIKGQGFMVVYWANDYLHVWILAGRMKAGYLNHLVPFLERIAGRGVKGISLQGRPGWRRALAPYGFEPKGEYMVKAL